MVFSVFFRTFARSVTMKYKGAVCDYTEERDADLLRAYKNIISVRDNISFSEIVERISKSPSKRFWVSEGRAYRVVLDMLKGKDLKGMIPSRREMYTEIFRRFKIHAKQNPSLTKIEVVWHVCNEEAPSFYLTRKSIITILSKVRKEEKRRCYELRKRRLRFMLGTL